MTDSMMHDPAEDADTCGKHIVRVVVAKAGLDGHDRGAKVIARALRDSGMEVIYTGIRQTAKQIVETVMQEDAGCLAVSILSGAHNQVFPDIMALIKAEGLDDVLVLAGGIIPEADVPGLKKLGVREFFGPGTSTAEVVSYVRDHVTRRPSAV